MGTFDIGTFADRVHEERRQIDVLTETSARLYELAEDAARDVHTARHHLDKLKAAALAAHPSLAAEIEAVWLDEAGA